MPLDLPTAEPLPTEVDPRDLRIERLRALRGPNFWRHSPVIACDVSLGPLDGAITNRLSGFEGRLLDLIPTLTEHGCSEGGGGEFVEQLRRGTHLPHVLEHVAIELQTLAGPEIGFGRALRSGDEGIWWVIVAYEEEELGLRSMREAVEVLRTCITGEPYDIGATVEQLRVLVQARREEPELEIVRNEP